MRRHVLSKWHLRTATPSESCFSNRLDGREESKNPAHAGIMGEIESRRILDARSARQRKIPQPRILGASGVGRLVGLVGLVCLEVDWMWTEHNAAS